MEEIDGPRGHAKCCSRLEKWWWEETAWLKRPSYLFRMIA